MAITWNNELLETKGGYDFVKYTSNEGKSFTKRYKSGVNLQQKLTEMTTKLGINDYLKVNMLNVTYPITTGWSYKVTKVDMTYDFIDIFIDVITPNQILQKYYIVILDRDLTYVLNMFNSEKNKVKNMVDTNDQEGLNDFFNVEVIL